MVKLGINIDHVATLRQARREQFPDVVEAARACEHAGADGITVHLREDRRHIQDLDVRLLRKALRTKLNLEMAVIPEIVAIACDIRPDDVCLVPEKRQELTTEGGLDVAGSIPVITPAIGQLKKAGIRVSIFIDPIAAQIEAAAQAGADAVELHTGAYAELCKKYSATDALITQECLRLTQAGALARKKGLILNAGHGLDYRNVAPIIAIEDMHELNIGFAIIARALFIGLSPAVAEMKKTLSSPLPTRSVR